MDEEYGLELGAFTTGLAQLMALVGIAFSFEESEKWLSEFHMFEIVVSYESPCLRSLSAKISRLLML